MCFDYVFLSPGYHFYVQMNLRCLDVHSYWLCDIKYDFCTPPSHGWFTHLFSCCFCPKDPQCAATLKIANERSIYIPQGYMIRLNVRTVAGWWMSFVIGVLKGGYLLTADFITQAIPLKPSWTEPAGHNYHNGSQSPTPSDPVQSEKKKGGPEYWLTSELPRVMFKANSAGPHSVWQILHTPIYTHIYKQTCTKDNRLSMLCSVKCANNKMTVIVALCELVSQKIRINQCGVSYYFPHEFGTFTK